MIENFDDFIKIFAFENDILFKSYLIAKIVKPSKRSLKLIFKTMIHHGTLLNRYQNLLVTSKISQRIHPIHNTKLALEPNPLIYIPYDLDYKP